MLNGENNRFQGLTPGHRISSGLRPENHSHHKVDEIEKNPAKFKKQFLFVLVLCSITTFVFIAYNSYKYTMKPVSINEIPLVERDVGPIRVIPSEPGGEQFSNQDKFIYNNFEDPKVITAQKKISVEDKQNNQDNPIIQASGNELLDDEEEKFNQTKVNKPLNNNANPSAQPVTLKDSIDTKLNPKATEATTAAPTIAAAPETTAPAKAETKPAAKQDKAPKKAKSIKSPFDVLEE
jgi:hypothetical protein